LLSPTFAVLLLLSTVLEVCEALLFGIIGFCAPFGAPGTVGAPAPGIPVVASVAPGIVPKSVFGAAPVLAPVLAPLLAPVVAPVVAPIVAPAAAPAAAPVVAPAALLACVEPLLATLEALLADVVTLLACVVVLLVVETLLLVGTALTLLFIVDWF